MEIYGISILSLDVYKMCTVRVSATQSQSGIEIKDNNKNPVSS